MVRNRRSRAPLLQRYGAYTAAHWTDLFAGASPDDLPHVMRPREEGGHLHHKGQVEVVSSLERDGRIVPQDIRKGVWVVVEAETMFAAALSNMECVRIQAGVMDVYTGRGI